MNFEELNTDKRLEFIGAAVQEFMNSKQMRDAAECALYYETDNPKIAKRRKTYVAAKGEAEDGTMRAEVAENKFAANEKVASSYFRDITDAKVQYLAGEGADINALSEAEDDIKAVKSLTNALGDQLKRVEQECLTDALVYSRGYCYLQVINGRLKLQQVPYCEVKPYRDRYNNLKAVLRYYRQGGKEYAEFHTAEKIYNFVRAEKSQDAKGWAFEGESPQIITAIVYANGETQEIGGKGWARLPWFELKHNKNGTSSLTNSVKTMICCYDVVVSDFANNLIDMQDVFINIKDSYGSGMEYGEVVEMLKKFKVGEGVESVTTFEVPYQAREALLNRLNTSIYKALRGVDLAQVAGGQRTAKEIKALYSDIDLWADQAEWQINDWVQDIIETAASYLGITLPPVKITNQRRVMFDEVEQMDALARQKGIISDKTLFESHPLVASAQAELERMAAQELDPAYSAGI